MGKEMTDSIISLASLKVGYGRKCILKDINLNIEAGRIVTLIGPNGAGKSTILKTIVQELKSLGGSIILEDRDMSELSGNEIARRLSMVMTERPKPELMTCREVVGTGRYPYVGKMGILSKEDWAKVDEAIELLEAKDIAASYFSQISDGQKQRIMLARALCQEPEVLVLDEPTTFLDVRYKLELLSIIQRVAREKNIAVIMSLHELDLAIKISDYICAVDGDSILATDSPENIIESGIIEELYHISSQNYQPLTGSIYLEGSKEKPSVFIIGGGGSGIPYYYKMQRKGISFVAGVLAMEDVEYQVAEALAYRVVHPKAFSPFGEKELEEAISLMDSCEYYLCLLSEFGELNQMNERLLEHAIERGMKKWQK